MSGLGWLSCVHIRVGTSLVLRPELGCFVFSLIQTFFLLYCFVSLNIFLFLNLVCFNPFLQYILFSLFQSCITESFQNLV